MPLSTPAPRAPIHNRGIVCDGYRREDGSWDIEGRLLDTRSYLSTNPFGDVPAGEPIHEMRARLTITDSFEILAVECVSDNSPFPTCGAIVGNFQRLVGERIGSGWSRKVKELVGGVEGCAHHVELFCLLGTVAFQTVGPWLVEQNAGRASRPDSKFILNTCHIWRDDGDMVRFFFPGDQTPRED